MNVPVYNLKGEQVGEVNLPEHIFGVKVSQPLMHQALLRQLANARLGTHDTKTRGEVNRTTKKVWRQKGTGRARQGSRKAPHWVGGGVAFGPHPRSYKQDMPKRMRRQAIRCALSQKAADQQIIIVDQLDLPAPRTKDFVAVMKALNVEKGLFVLPGRNENVEKSAANVPNAKTIHAMYLNIRDLFKYDKLVLPLASLQVIEGWLGKAK
ncbi:MAG: 50S ribosomal protein L4 [Thermoflexales bacterium]|nr:50S ribosomal protein L4 [Thermoflexales bacterium]MCS7325599.1 50S ribosomal protein L4 [Thermoflexales bacterium]MDW8053818.1 50S ribosomal protein L4 [Anaerolineae bacterium]MDW8292349.1 50S ribosomal protein L4 [Anaerolineae bacterium]